VLGEEWRWKAEIREESQLSGAGLIHPGIYSFFGGQATAGLFVAWKSVTSNDKAWREAVVTVMKEVTETKTDQEIRSTLTFPSVRIHWGDHFSSWATTPEGSTSGKCRVNFHVLGNDWNSMQALPVLYMYNHSSGHRSSLDLHQLL